MAFEDFSDGAALAASSLDNMMAQTTIICTSGTRPSAPSEGWHIYETDTNREYVYNGSWQRTANYSTGGARTGCKLVRNANQTITHNSSTAVSWDTETYDSDGFIAVTSDTIVIPANLGGLYMASANVLWTSDPRTGGNTFVEVTMAGKTFRNASTSSYAIDNCVFAIWPLSASDQVQVNVLQMSTGSASLAFTQANITLVRVGL